MNDFAGSLSWPGGRVLRWAGGETRRKIEIGHEIWLSRRWHNKASQRSLQWVEGGVTTIVVSALLAISWRVYTVGRYLFGPHGPESLGLQSWAQVSSCWFSVPSSD